MIYVLVLTFNIVTPRSYFSIQIPVAKSDQFRRISIKKVNDPFYLNIISLIDMCVFTAEVRMLL